MCGVSFRGDQSILELHKGDSCILCMYKIITEL